MDSLYILIPIALIFCVIAIRLLIWAVNSGQYDDLDKEAWRILADDTADDLERKQADDPKNQPAGSTPPDLRKQP